MTTLGAPWNHYILAAVPGEPGRAVAVVVEQAIGLGRGLVAATAGLDLRYAGLIPAGTGLPDVAARLVKRLTGLEGIEQGASGVAFLLGTSLLGDVLTARLGEAGRWPARVEITGGGHVGWSESGAALLPRRDLAAGLLMAAQEGRLKMSERPEVAERLTAALRTFQFRPAASPDPFDVARREEDDALVLAAGLAVWQAGREVPGRRGATIDARRSGLGDYDPHAALERW